MDGQTIEFSTPEKKIKSPLEMRSWLGSEAYATYVGFILHLNDAVKNKTLQHKCSSSENLVKVDSVLQVLDTWIDEIPPQEQPMRYGNMAYRDWHAKITSEEGMDMIKELLPPGKLGALQELRSYWTDSFGNATRIDYGTGHEAAFIMFLCCLFKLKVLEESDTIAAVIVLFQRYMKLVRKLQQTYKMEPAGSQGVWSLDDYQFVVFIWGSAQLIDHPNLDPKGFTDPTLVEHNSFDYMFMDAIKYINDVKSGPFAEHSNQLWNISAVEAWSKVNSGLIKMYKAEVLEKFPVVQHFWFGSLLSFTPVKKED